MDFSWISSLKQKIEDRRVFGLDIGSSSVSAVQLRKKGGGWVVTAANRVKMPPNENEEQEHRQINTVNTINKCLEPIQTRTRLAVCSISGPEAAVRDFKFPSLPSDEMESAVMFEATQVCPFNADDIIVDYQSLSNDQDAVSGLLVAATNQLVESKVKLAKQASIDCVLMDVDGLALLNCLSECEKDGSSQTTTAILNIGSSYTTLAIMNGRGTQSAPFVRDVSYAGIDIVKAIAEEKNMSIKDVESAIGGFEGCNHTEEPVTFKDSLEKACEKLIVDVTETLRYYTAQEKSSFVERIFVCGGFAMVQGLVELLDKQLPTKIVLWNPFEKIGCTAGQSCEEMLKKEGPAMAIAAGLAMRSI